MFKVKLLFPSIAALSVQHFCKSEPDPKSRSENEEHNQITACESLVKVNYSASCRNSVAETGVKSSYQRWHSTALTLKISCLFLQFPALTICLPISATNAARVLYRMFSIYHSYMSPEDYPFWIEYSTGPMKRALW